MINQSLRANLVMDVECRLIRMIRHKPRLDTHFQPLDITNFTSSLIDIMKCLIQSE